MVRHTNQCAGQNANTSPLGSIVSDDQEVEISIPTTAPPQDPHMAGLQYATPEETQSTEGNSRVSTVAIMSATDESTHVSEELDPLQTNEEIDIKENLYDLIEESILEKVPLEEYGESTDSDEADFKHLDFLVPDEILSSPDISFTTEDNVTSVTSDLPSSIKG